LLGAAAGAGYVGTRPRVLGEAANLAGQLERSGFPGRIAEGTTQAIPRALMLEQAPELRRK
jgi:hypothetical protein